MNTLRRLIQPSLLTWCRRVTKIRAVKSVVKSSLTGDIFEAVTTQVAVSLPRAVAGLKEARPPLSIELAGPWGFYRTFLPAHGLPRLPQASVAEIAIAAGSPLQIPLLIRNDGTSPREVTL
jgi:hypothetical protein